MEKQRPKRERKANTTPYEHDEQVGLVNLLTMRGILFTSVPNGGTRSNKREARRLKEEGLQKGFPDLIVFTPPPKRPDVRLVCVEMKRIEGSSIEPEQKEWHEKLRSVGIETIIAYGWYDGAKQLTEIYGYDLI